MQKIVHFFLRGLVLVAPVSITIYILVSSLRYLDDLLNIEIPGLGILILLAGITLVGALSQTLLINPLLGYLEKVITKVPLAALIYSSLKDLLSAFVGDKRKFEQPVRVELIPGSGVWQIGFITQNALDDVFGPGKLAVYFPDSYNISGKVWILDRDRVVPLDWRSTDAMKFVVSGGVAYSGSAQVNV